MPDPFSDNRPNSRGFLSPDGPRSPSVERPGTPDRLRALTLPEPEAVEPRDELLYQVTRGYINAARSNNTRRAYDRDVTHFRNWCEAGGYQYLPAAVETVQFYLADHAEKLAIATLQRRLVGISRAHKEAGHTSPTSDVAVRDTLQGIRREAAEMGRSVQRQAMPIMVDELKELIAATNPDTLLGKRDRALLLLAFAGALRAGEVGRINVSDLRETKLGYILTIRRSKTDQSGKGQEIAIPKGREESSCPVKAIKSYLEAAQIKSGPILRYVDRHDRLRSKAVGISCYSVVRVVRRVANAAGWENLDKLSGHSLRSGLASSAALANVPAFKIQIQGRWKKRDMVDRYSRDVEIFRLNAVSEAGL